MRTESTVKTVLVGLATLGIGLVEGGVAEQVSAYRIRGAFEVGLNADEGWAAAVNAGAEVLVDRPFRLRLQVESEAGRDALRHYVLWYRRNGGEWKPVVDADFPYPAYASPVVSMVAAPYAVGAATADLLPQAAEVEHGEDGAGQGLVAVTTRAGETGVAAEWEFPLVIRYYADGPECLEDGDRIAFRLSQLHGAVLEAGLVPEVTVRVPDGHLGGTFVETPGRIGPWRGADGSLYFIMEPTETDNRFMIVASRDNGRSWREVDGGQRPPARDLEAVDAVRVGDMLHIAHMEDTVWYHAFRMATAGGAGEGWVTGSEWVGVPEDAPMQSVGIEVLADGRVVLVHADGAALVVRTRTAAGAWPEVGRIAAATRLSGIQMVRGAADVLYLVYGDGMGRAWLQLWRDGALRGEAVMLSDGLGRAEADCGSLLPPVYLAEAGEVVVAYRKADGSIEARRWAERTGVLGAAERIVAGPVIQNAVDSDQVGADLIVHEGVLHLFYIPERGRALCHVRSTLAGEWSEEAVLVDGIEASWVRAEGVGSGRIGYVYDAGSKGGSGMNRYGEWVRVD